MIDFSSIKNKSIVTIAHQNKNVECEVISDTPSACTVTLPDGSITTVGKMHVLAVKQPTAKLTSDKE